MVIQISQREHTKSLNSLLYGSFVGSLAIVIPVIITMQKMQSDDSAMRMEERFEEHVKKKFSPDEKRSTSGVIYAAFGEKIKKCLKNPELFFKEFRYYVKKNFRVFEIPSLGLKDVLVIARPESDKEV